MDKSYLKCKFCNEQFDTESRSPKMLYACGHSICATCLRGYIDKKEFFHCIEDGTRISLTDTKPEHFPPNLVLLNMLRDNQTKVKPVAKEQAKVTEREGDEGKLVTATRKKNLLRKEFSERKLHQPEAMSVISDNRTVYHHKNRAEPRRDRHTVLDTAEKSLYAHNVGSEDSFGSEQTDPAEVCETHRKRLEAVCEEQGCRTRVCLECGLFGAHSVG